MAKILVVDDDPRIVRMLRRRLKKAGFETIDAADGNGGVELALAESPDLILMDMYMPGKNGYQATESLRSQGYAGLICAFTASAFAMDERKCLECGCDYFISKPPPINFEDMLNEIIRGGRPKAGQA